MTLARTEFKLRYYDSFLGYLWSLIRPLLFFGVIYLVFTEIFKVGRGIPHYGVYLLAGIVYWTYFSETTNGCVQCLLSREALLRKIQFPRLAIPVSVSLTAIFNLGVNFIPVLAFALASGITPTLSWLELLPIALGYIVLATGVGMLLAALYVPYRDIKPIWEVLSQVLFYCSPIMYDASKYKGLEGYALMNPIAMLQTQMGHAFVSPKLPSAAVAAGGAIRLVIPISLIVLSFVIGAWVFTREAPKVAEIL
jgi:ABC-2 type transport system permease protein